MELRLAFGTSSSPALFDWPNWVLTRTTMRKTGIPAQWVQKQLDDLCIATPPTKRVVMEDFVKTHRSTCARVGGFCQNTSFYLAKGRGEAGT